MQYIQLSVFTLCILLAACSGGGGGSSNPANMPTPPIPPVVLENTFNVAPLSIPTTGYGLLNNAELGTVLTSPTTHFNIPENTLSFSISLTGEDVAFTGRNLFITDLVQPNGNPINNAIRDLTFCDSGLCSALVPRTPQLNLTDNIIPAGEWQYSLGTLAASLTNIDLNAMTLNIAIRTGPTPDLEADFPARLTIKPFLTAVSVDTDDITLVLEQFRIIAENNNIAVDIQPLSIITEPRFTEVSGDFNDPETAALVTLGDANAINIFFLEDFSGTAATGLIGISAGLPGAFGTQGKFNGVLINANATRNSGDTFYARTTAEFTFHEIGHFIGLYHTSERLFGIYDVLPDTQQCLVSDDLNNNGIADFNECPDGLNIMFWNSDLNLTKAPLSNDQKNVFFLSPLASP
ncbi:MAG: hypothetical protein KUG79_18550 [Pseudomonadales bacterium]|nr:hypothetical protein [Pseudomonadales bacterium]